MREQAEECSGGMLGKMAIWFGKDDMAPSQQSLDNAQTKKKKYDDFIIAKVSGEMFLSLKDNAMAELNQSSVYPDMKSLNLTVRSLLPIIPNLERWVMMLMYRITNQMVVE